MQELLAPADWTFPVPVKYGRGRLAELGALCRQAGMQHPLLVTDRGSLALPFVDQALTSMATSGMQAGVFADVSPNPTEHDIAAGRVAFDRERHDGVVAIGGGSGMDAGKAISLVAASERDLLSFDESREPAAGLGSGDFVPLICIPTTAGTGAETESTAMVTDTGEGVKRCVWHPAQKPRAAILDPDLTLGLPANLTAWTGVDALVHAIEAFCVPHWHPMCDGLALQAIRLIHRWLPLAVNDGTNVEARGAMLVGSCIAGVSFVKGLGLVHAVSHMVGAVYDTHHGLTNAVLLAPVLRYNERGLGDKTALLCEAMALPGRDFRSLYAAIIALLDQLEIPRGLAELGVREQRVAEIARKAHTDVSRATNPVPASVAEIETLVREALTAGR